MPNRDTALLNIRGAWPDLRRAFSAGAVRMNMNQAPFLAWLMEQYAADIVKPPQEVSK